MNVTCSKCCGTGQRPLTKVEATTISVLTDEWQDTTDVAEKLVTDRKKMGRTTVCQRLARLSSAGLIERRERPDSEIGDGRMLQWRRKP